MQPPTDDLQEEKEIDDSEFKAKIDFAYRDDFDEHHMGELESLASVRKSNLSDSKAYDDSSNQATPSDLNKRHARFSEL